MCLLPVLGSQGVVVKYTAASFFRSVKYADKDHMGAVYLEGGRI